MNWIEQYGLLAVFAGTLLEGESILALAGFAAHLGYLDIRAVVLVAVAGGALGDQFFFWFGRISGPPLLDRYQPLRQAAERLAPSLNRHDALLVITIRFLYGLRIAGPIAMGALGVKPRRFLIFNVVGAAIWAPLVAGVGYLFGHVVQAWLGEVERYEGVLLAAAAACAVLFWLAHRVWRARNRRLLACACVGAALLAAVPSASSAPALDGRQAETRSPLKY